MNLDGIVSCIMLEFCEFFLGIFIFWKIVLFTTRLYDIYASFRELKLF